MTIGRLDDLLWQLVTQARAAEEAQLAALIKRTRNIILGKEPRPLTQAQQRRVESQKKSGQLSEMGKRGAKAKKEMYGDDFYSRIRRFGKNWREEES